MICNFREHEYLKGFKYRANLRVFLLRRPKKVDIHAVQYVRLAACRTTDKIGSPNQQTNRVLLILSNINDLLKLPSCFYLIQVE